MQYPKFKSKLAVALGLLTVALAVTFVPQFMESSHAQHANHKPAASAGSVNLYNPWTRATAPGAKAAGGFVSLENKGATDKLLSASAGVSDVVELHTMSMDGGMMKMRMVDSIELPQGKTVDLKPGSFHVMFIGLKAPLEAGKSFPLTLKFEKAGTVTVDMKVQAVNYGGASKDHEHKH